MTPSDRKDRDVIPNAVDVVDGPVGSAWLKDPNASGPAGADRGCLPDATPPAGIDDAPEEPEPKPIDRP